MRRGGSYDPPGLAEALLRAFLPEDPSSGAILGDLREDCLDLRATRSRRRVDVWYWGQAISIAARFATKKRLHARHEGPGWGPPGSGSAMSGFAIDLRGAGRKLARSPSFAVTAIVTLALGIGSTVAMFSVLDAALLRALPYPDPDQLVFGRATFDGRINETVSYPDYIDYRDESDVFESLSLIRSGIQGLTIAGDDGPERLAAKWVTVDLFRTLGVDVQLGRGFAAEEAEPGSNWVAVISQGFWQRHFGSSADAVGSTLVLGGFQNTVVGVMPGDFRFRDDVDVWLPIRDGIMDTGGRRSHSWQIIGRLRRGIPVDRAQVQVDLISEQLALAYPESHEGKAMLLTPLDEALEEDYRQSLIVLMAATGLLLLIACGNVASLLTARATTLKSEISIRAVLGASRRRILRQLFAESLVLASVAGVLGAALGLWIQRLILAFMPLDLLGIRDIGLSGPMLGFAVAVSACTAVVFGAGPALTASRTDPAGDLRGGRRSSEGRRSGRLRGGLVVLQVALTVVLLSASGLLLRSLVNLRSVDVGFDTGNLLVASVQLPPSEYEDAESRTRYFHGLVDDLQAMPGVISASFISHIPIRDRYMDWSVWDPAHPPAADEDRPSAYSRTVLPGYFETMGMPLLGGRDHEYADAGNTRRLVVVSESLAESLFPGQDPIGREVSVFNAVTDPMPYAVIGVVANTRVTSLDRDPFPQMYFNHVSSGYTAMNLVARTTSSPLTVVEAVRNLVRARDPNVLMSSVTTMEGIVAESLSANRLLSVTLNIFAAVALFLAVTGIYGVLAFSVGRRTHEIGIRVALGATTGDIARRVLRGGLLLVGAGLVIGIPGALVTSVFLQWQLFGVQSTDPLTYAAVAGIFLTVGALACLIPARRALGVDPMEAFGAE